MKRAFARALALLFVATSALGGCATGNYWTKQGATEQDFKRDYYQCMKDFRAGAGSKYPRNLSYEEKCLEAQGYKMGADTNSNHHELAKPLP